MPRLLILTFYYPPDLSAGSFRCKGLIDAIELQRKEDLEVEIITTSPNRYRESSVAAAACEQHGWLTIRRIALPSHQSRMLDQAWAFLSFAIKAVKLTRDRDYDAVFATSSRLMTAALGALIGRNKNRPLYLDIRDLFVDTIGDVLTNPLVRRLMPFFAWLERRTFAQAEAISIVSAAFEPYVKSIAKTKKIWLFTNGIDQEFLDRPFNKSYPGTQFKPTILYAGNLGEGQGLEQILPQAAAILADKANFKVIGSGGRLQHLQAATDGYSNVEILPPVSRDVLLEHYRDADMLFMHLNDHQAFQKVLPSKLFEYAATGKPIIAGVSGHAADFIQQNVTGAFVFAPLDTVGLIEALDCAVHGAQHYDRTEFCRNFARDRLMSNMAEKLLSDVFGGIGSKLK